MYDTPAVWSKLRGKIEDSIALLPAEASRPEFNELEVAAYAWIGAIVWQRDDAELFGVMRRLCAELKDSLGDLPGTKVVDLFGDPLEEVIVEVNAERAAAAGLSATAIAMQLQASDVKSAIGLLRSADRELMVEMQNEFHTLEDILESPIHTNRFGHTLARCDVATVRRSTREPPAAKAIIDGRPGIVVATRLRPEYRYRPLVTDAKRVVEEFGATAGGRGTAIPNGTSDVRARAYAIAVVQLAHGCHSRCRRAFLVHGLEEFSLVTATLPLAALMVVAGMRFMDIPIHLLSITGLIIAIGMLIDNAIIAAD